jgi:hypothetical protein
MEYIPGSTVPATTLELQALAEAWQRYQENPELYQWAGPLQKPPAWDAEQQLFLARAQWAAAKLSGDEQLAQQAAGTAIALANLVVQQRAAAGLMQSGLAIAKEPDQNGTEIPQTPLDSMGSATPGTGTTATLGTGTTATKPSTTSYTGSTTFTSGTTMADASLDDLIIQRAGGNNYYSWDEWNWFYEQVTGQPGPAPEDRGLTRNAAGQVIINGSARYPYATWKKYAFPNGFGVEPGKTSPPGDKPGIPEPPSIGLLALIERLLKMVLAFVVGGKRV